jgi:hypothetical protein
MSGTLPSHEELTASVRDALQHEGHQGLWEIVKTLNATNPAAPLSARIALAREGVAGAVVNSAVCGRCCTRRRERGRSCVTPCEFLERVPGLGDHCAGDDESTAEWPMWTSSGSR